MRVAVTATNGWGSPATATSADTAAVAAAPSPDVVSVTLTGATTYSNGPSPALSGGFTVTHRPDGSVKQVSGQATVTSAAGPGTARIELLVARVGGTYVGYLRLIDNLAHVNVLTGSLTQTVTAVGANGATGSFSVKLPGQSARTSISWTVVDNR